MPAFVNLNEKVAPTGILPLSKTPLSVTVCAMPPLFVQMTVEPTAMVTLAGVKPALVIETETVVGFGAGVGVGLGVGVACGLGVGVGARVGVACGLGVGVGAVVGAEVAACVGAAVGLTAVNWLVVVGVADEFGVFPFPNAAVRP